MIGCSCSNQNKSKLDAIAYRIESTINNRQPEYLNSMLSYKLFLSDAFEFFKPSREDQSMLIRTYKDKFKLGNILLDMTKGTGGITFLKQDENVIIFNVYSENILNYVEFRFSKELGEFKIEDIYVYSWGCTIAEQMIESTKVVSKEIGEGIKDHRQQVKLLRGLLDSNKIEEAKIEFAKFSDEFKELNMIKIIELSIVTRDTLNNETEYINQYIKTNPSSEKFLSYLYFTKAFYEDDCDHLNMTSKALSYYTGIDPVLNDYVANCEK